MKAILLACALVSASVEALAQDPGMAAAQQAVDQQIQIQQMVQIQQQQIMEMQQIQQQQVQQMMQDNALLFSDGPCWTSSGWGRRPNLKPVSQATQFNQFAAQQIQSLTAPLQNGKRSLNIPVWGTWRTVPLNNQMTLSVPPGVVQPGTQVRINWRGKEDDKVVYYTTDGWSPNPSSNRYTGPVTITGPTHLQAVAIAAGPGHGACPNWWRSQILDAYYDVPGSATPSNTSAIVTNGTLREGTTLNLVAVAAVDSMAVRTGDQVPMLLDQDVTDGSKIMIPKGTPVDAVLAAAVRPQGGRSSGLLVVTVRGLNQAGTTIPLHAVETTEGHPGGVPLKAVIEPGMKLQAVVTEDVKLEQ